MAILSAFTLHILTLLFILVYLPISFDRLAFLAQFLALITLFLFFRLLINFNCLFNLKQLLSDNQLLDLHFPLKAVQVEPPGAFVALETEHVTVLREGEVA